MDRFSTRLGASLIADRHRAADADRRLARAGSVGREPVEGALVRIRQAMPGFIRFRPAPR